MKLWILRPIEGKQNDPWDPWYDKAFGFVVRAESEAEARALITGMEAGDETNKNLNPWHDTNYSTCTELSADGAAGVIMKDFQSA